MIGEIFRLHDIPPGRAPDSYAFQVDHIWDGAVVDTYYTDSPDAAAWLAERAREEAYDCRTSGPRVAEP